MHKLLSQFSFEHFFIVLELQDLQDTKDKSCEHWLQYILQLVHVIFLHMLQNKAHL